MAECRCCGLSPQRYADIQHERDRYRKAIEVALPWTDKENIETFSDAMISLRDIRSILADALKEEPPAQEP